MSSRYQPKAGIGMAGRWMVPGEAYWLRHKFATGAGVQEIKIDFPSLTRSITIFNETSNNAAAIMRIHSSARTGDLDVVAADLTGHNFQIKPGESFSFDLKAGFVYVSVDDASAADAFFDLYAEVTGVTDVNFVHSTEGVSS